MLAELNALVPKGRHEKVERGLVPSIIALKHRMELGIHWSNKLTNQYNQLANQYGDDLKNVVYSLNNSMIYGLQI